MREHEFQGGMHPSSRNADSPCIPTISSESDLKPAPSRWDSHRGTTVALIDELPLRRVSTLNLLRCHLRDGARSFANTAELLAQVSSTGENPGCIITCVGGRSVTEPPWSEELVRLGIGLSSTPVIILSDREDSAEVVAAFRRGARGYIPTSLNPTLAIEALRIVLAGGMFLPAESLIRARRKTPPQITLRTAPDQPADRREQWSPRLLAVLRLLVQGKANKEIAQSLMMEECKVKVHIGLIMRRLGATNRTQAALRARRLGIPATSDGPSPAIAAAPNVIAASISRLEPASASI